MFAVEFWGSDPDLGNDDCWYGGDHDSEAEARAAFSAPCDDHEVAFIVLSRHTGEVDERFGCPVLEELERRPNPAFDAARLERERAADDRAWRSEFAMQTGMAFGCAGFNDAMGW